MWHFQTVHHDLFDYDLPAAPILVDITVDGKPIKALAQLTKQGFVFVLDRVDGQTRVADRGAARAEIDRAGRVHVAHTTGADEAAAVREPEPDDERPHRLHTRAARAGARDREALHHGPDVHPAVGHRQRAGRDARHDPGARRFRRRELERRRVRSRDRHAVRRLALRRVRRRPVRARSRALGSALPRRHARDDERPAGLTADETAVRPHHRVQPEQGRRSRGWCRTPTARAIILR